MKGLKDLKKSPFSTEMLQKERNNRAFEHISVIGGEIMDKLCWFIWNLSF